MAARIPTKVHIPRANITSEPIIDAARKAHPSYETSCIGNGSSKVSNMVAFLQRPDLQLRFEELENHFPNAIFTDSSNGLHGFTYRLWLRGW